MCFHIAILNLYIYINVVFISSAVLIFLSGVTLNFPLFQLLDILICFILLLMFYLLCESKSLQELHLLERGCLNLR